MTRYAYQVQAKNGRWLAPVGRFVSVAEARAAGIEHAAVHWGADRAPAYVRTTTAR